MSLSEGTDVADDPGRYRLRADGIVWREVDDQVIVLEMDSGIYLNLNASGRVLWKALSQSASMDELATSLIESFDVPQEKALRDSQAFLDDLTQRSLVEPIG